MKIRLTILTTFLIFCLSSYGQINSERENLEPPAKSYKIDTSVFAILPFDTTIWKAYGRRPADLTNDDLLKIEEILHKSIDDYNPGQEIRFKEFIDKHPKYKIDRNDFIIDLSRYVRQYMAIITTKGEKEVWVQCLCSVGGPKWRKYWWIVSDGGNCFFSLKINLTTGQYYQFHVNGSA